MLLELGTVGQCIYSFFSSPEATAMGELIGLAGSNCPRPSTVNHYLSETTGSIVTKFSLYVGVRLMEVVQMVLVT